MGPTSKGRFVVYADAGRGCALRGSASPCMRMCCARGQDCHCGGQHGAGMRRSVGGGVGWERGSVGAAINHAGSLRQWCRLGCAPPSAGALASRHNALLLRCVRGKWGSLCMVRRGARRGRPPHIARQGRDEADRCMWRGGGERRSRRCMWQAVTEPTAVCGEMGASYRMRWSVNM